MPTHTFCVISVADRADTPFQSLAQGLWGLVGEEKKQVQFAGPQLQVSSERLTKFPGQISAASPILG